MKLTLIAGARPNFMKIAPIIQAIELQKAAGNNIDYRLVHTGQHYDRAMSGSFFEQLNIPDPHVNLECGGGTQAEQTAAIMVAFEKELADNPTDWVVVVGDVTSTLACSIVAKKACIKLAHVEGGIRSGDLSMPEEINRMVTDSISDLFFTTSETANTLLRKSGFPEEQIVFVGNTMIDTLLQNQHRFFPPPFWEAEQLSKGNYLVMTLHRPSNVDDPGQLTKLFAVLEGELQGRKVIFPVHPRTQKNMERFGISPKNVFLSPPMSYLEFNFLVQHAFGVITDSGGITEETTVLGIPCLTLRDSTERPETCSIGTNELVGTEPEQLRLALKKLFSGTWKKGNIPPLWDGKSAERIVQHYLQASK